MVLDERTGTATGTSQTRWRPPSPLRFPARLLSWTIAGILWTLQYPLGRKINERADAFAYLQGYEKDDLLPADAKLPESTVELLGYKASRNVVFTFSLIFAITAICWELGKPWQSKLLNTVTHLFSNALFAACATIVILATMERFLPEALWWIVNKLIPMRKRMWARAIKRERRALGLLR